jgi:hypothetical protein
MKTKLLITAFAAAAMLMSGTSAATAQGVRRHDMGGNKQHMERRFDSRKPGPSHFGKKNGPAHRPVIGARFNHRPAFGRFITHNRERLLLVDGVLYREVRTVNGIAYIVVGYI